MTPRKYGKLTSNADGSTTYQSGEEVVHVCNKEEMLNRHDDILERTNKILYGNGAPKDGLVFRFDKFMDDHEQVVSDISDIKASVSFLAGKYDATLEAVTTTASSLERYKIEVASFDAGKKDAEGKEDIAANLKAVQKRDKRQLFFWIVAAVVAIVSLWGGLYFGFTKLNQGQASIKSETKITNEILAPPGTVRGIQYKTLVDSMEVKDSTK